MQLVNGFFEQCGYTKKNTHIFHSRKIQVWSKSGQVLTALETSSSVLMNFSLSQKVLFYKQLEVSITEFSFVNIIESQNYSDWKGPQEFILLNATKKKSSKLRKEWDRRKNKHQTYHGLDWFLNSEKEFHLLIFEQLVKLLCGALWSNTVQIFVVGLCSFERASLKWGDAVWPDLACGFGIKREQQRGHSKIYLCFHSYKSLR